MADGFFRATKLNMLEELLALCKVVVFSSGEVPSRETAIDVICNCGCDRMASSYGRPCDMETTACDLIDFLVAHGAVEGKRGYAFDTQLRKN